MGLKDNILFLLYMPVQVLGRVTDVFKQLHNATSDLMQSRAVYRTVIRIALSAIFVAIQGVVAVLAYYIFYNQVMPDQIAAIPLYLQYGADVHYDVSISLCLPPSPVNLVQGNFMVTVHLLDTADDKVNLAGSPRNWRDPDKELLLEGANVLDTYRRPLLIPYADPMVSFASRLLFLPLNVLRNPPKQEIVLTTDMVQNIPFGGLGKMPALMFLEVEAGQSLQVYSFAVTLTSHLGGARWIMHHYWAFSFVVLTSMFWLVEMVFTFLAWTILNATVGYRLGFNALEGRLIKPGDIKREVDGDDYEEGGEGGEEEKEEEKEEEDEEGQINDVASLASGVSRGNL
ncbi:putative tubulin-tyrosine ligase protein [Zalerion maritima]|uniref:Tubulin-tyrosine ligase protein n=1 Tax=Zalerion maritima TaxID=339359 RepID=A0AAD5RLI3_9PEZI|nr:putative tubulin-tyrosine ligase protein [Zalerion maritima]